MHQIIWLYKKVFTRTVFFIVLPLSQVASAILLVPFVNHILNAWYYPKADWIATIRAEFDMGGLALIVEIIVIAIAILLTIGFEIGVFKSSDKDFKFLKSETTAIKTELTSIKTELSAAIQQLNTDVTSTINNLANEIRLERESRIQSHYIETAKTSTPKDGESK